MSKLRCYSLGSLNLKVSPMLHKEGDLLRSVNVDSFPIGAKRKRSGYNTYLGTMPNGSTVQDLATWAQDNGTAFWNYAFAGGLIYYSAQGTGAWTIAGNGTFSAAGTLTTAAASHAYLGNMFFVSDGVGTVNYTTTGTSFVNNGTVLITGFINGTNDGTVGTVATPAPVAVSLSEFQQRIYVAGTTSFIRFSNAGYQNDWTNDSTSFGIRSGGKLVNLFKSNDRLIFTKSSGAMYRYNGGDILTDLVTNLGPTSTRSQGNIEDSQIYLNEQGFYSYSGNKPQLISNPIERQIYNDAGSGIAGTTFSNAPGEAYKYSYLASIGTVTDDLTGETISNAITVYNYLQNEWGNYQFAHRPNAWLSYTDSSGVPQLVFANGSQCYQLSGTATSDAGSPITSAIQGVLHFGNPESEKVFKYIWASFNPGAQARIQIAIADTYTREKLKWQDMGDCSNGIAEFTFPEGSRGRLLMYRVTESSATDRFTFYGISVEANTIDRK